MENNNGYDGWDISMDSMDDLDSIEGEEEEEEDDDDDDNGGDYLGFLTNILDGSCIQEEDDDGLSRNVDASLLQNRHFIKDLDNLSDFNLNEEDDADQFNEKRFVGARENNSLENSNLNETTTTPSMSSSLSSPCRLPIEDVRKRFLELSVTLRPYMVKKDSNLNKPKEPSKVPFINAELEEELRPIREKTDLIAKKAEEDKLLFEETQKTNVGLSSKLKQMDSKSDERDEVKVVRDSAISKVGDSAVPMVRESVVRSIQDILEERIIELQKMLEKKDTVIEEQARTISNLQLELVSKEAIYANSTEDVKYRTHQLNDKHKMEMDQLMSDNIKLKRELADLESKHDEIRISLHETQAKCLSLQGRNAVCNTLTNNLRDTIQIYAIVSEEMKRNAREICIEAVKMRADDTEVMGIILNNSSQTTNDSTLSTVLAEYLSALEKAGERVNQINARVNESIKVIELLDKANVDRPVDYDDELPVPFVAPKEPENDRYAEEFEEALQRYMQRVEYLRNEVQRFSQNNRETNDSLSLLREENTELKGRVETLEETVETLEGTVETLEGTVETLEKTVENQRASISSLTDEKCACDQLKAEMETNFENIRRIINDFEKTGGEHHSGRGGSGSDDDDDDTEINLSSWDRRDKYTDLNYSIEYATDCFHYISQRLERAFRTREHVMQQLSDETVRLREMLASQPSISASPIAIVDNKVPQQQQQIAQTNATNKVKHMIAQLKSKLQTKIQANRNLVDELEMSREAIYKLREENARLLASSKMLISKSEASELRGSTDGSCISNTFTPSENSSHLEENLASSEGKMKLTGEEISDYLLLQARLNEQLKRNETLQAKLTERVEHEKSLQTTLDNLAKENESLRIKLNNEINRTETLRANLAEQMEANENLRGDLNDEKTRIESVSSRLTNEIYRNEGLQANLSEQVEQNEILRRNLNDEKERFEDSQSRLTNEICRNEGLQANLSEQVDQNEILRRNLNDEKKRFEDSQSRLTNEINRNEDLQAKLAEQLEVSETIRKNLNDQSGLVGDLQIRLTNEINRNQVLQTSLSKQSESNETLRDNLKNELERAEDLQSRLTKETIENQTQQAILAANCQHAMEQKECLRNELEAMIRANYVSKTSVENDNVSQLNEYELIFDVIVRSIDELISSLTTGMRHRELTTAADDESATFLSNYTHRLSVTKAFRQPYDAIGQQLEGIKSTSVRAFLQQLVIMLEEELNIASLSSNSLFHLNDILPRFTRILRICDDKLPPLRHNDWCNFENVTVDYEGKEMERDGQLLPTINGLRDDNEGAPLNDERSICTNNESCPDTKEDAGDVESNNRQDRVHRGDTRSIEVEEGRSSESQLLSEELPWMAQKTDIELSNEPLELSRTMANDGFQPTNERIFSQLPVQVLNSINPEFLEFLRNAKSINVFEYENGLDVATDDFLIEIPATAITTSDGVEFRQNGQTSKRFIFRKLATVFPAGHCTSSRESNFVGYLNREIGTFLEVLEPAKRLRYAFDIIGEISRSLTPIFFDVEQNDRILAELIEELTFDKADIANTIFLLKKQSTLYFARYDVREIRCKADDDDNFNKGDSRNAVVTSFLDRREDIINGLTDVIDLLVDIPEPIRKQLSPSIRNSDDSLSVHDYLCTLAEMVQRVADNLNLCLVDSSSANQRRILLPTDGDYDKYRHRIRLYAIFVRRLMYENGIVRSVLRTIENNAGLQPGFFLHIADEWVADINANSVFHYPLCHLDDAAGEQRMLDEFVHALEDYQESDDEEEDQEEPGRELPGCCRRSRWDVLLNKELLPKYPDIVVVRETGDLVVPPLSQLDIIPLSSVLRYQASLLHLTKAAKGKVMGEMYNNNNNNNNDSDNESDNNNETDTDNESDNDFESATTRKTACSLPLSIMPDQSVSDVPSVNADNNEANSIEIDADSDSVFNDVGTKELVKATQSIKELKLLLKLSNDKIESLCNEQAEIKRRMSYKNQETLESRLQVALSHLRDSDLRCNQLANEINELTKERDALQLRLSQSLRENEKLRWQDVCVMQDDHPHDDDEQLKEKINDVHSIDLMKDPKFFKEIKLPQDMNVSNSEAENQTENTNHAGDNDSSWSAILPSFLNWFADNTPS